MQNLQKSEHSTHLIQKNHLLSATYSVDCPGVGLLVYCIVATVRARSSAEDDAELSVALQRLAAINMGALAVSAIGLMLVIVGIVFT